MQGLWRDSVPGVRRERDEMTEEELELEDLLTRAVPETIVVKLGAPRGDKLVNPTHGTVKRLIDIAQRFSDCDAVNVYMCGTGVLLVDLLYRRPLKKATP